MGVFRKLLPLALLLSLFAADLGAAVPEVASSTRASATQSPVQLIYDLTDISTSYRREVIVTVVALGGSPSDLVWAASLANGPEQMPRVSAIASQSTRLIKRLTANSPSYLHVGVTASGRTTPGRLLFSDSSPSNARGAGGMGSAGSSTSGGTGSWTFTITHDPSAGNCAEESALIAASSFTDRIARRANLVEERSQSPPARRFYSCFVSFSSADEEFVRTLVDDLRGHGVECWFAPDSLKIGDKTRRRIAEAIKSHEKLVVVISKDSARSQWVESEVELALAQERKLGETIIFPIRIDPEISDGEEGWAGDIQRRYNVGNLSHWQDETRYHAALARVLSDLTKD